jgi:sodium/hydrogen exchanger 8
VFLFCYFCYAAAESLELSGVMALFFYGIVLSHYNAYNLSDDSRRATEQIFATLATVSEIIVFLYMGMGVFTTGKFKLSENLSFSLFSIVFCILGRFLNIMPLSCAANACRKGNDKISLKMQLVLWFAGLRGAIAYALAVNMPGENKETYVTGTLTICIITTIVCGGFTEKVLVAMGMKESDANDNDDDIVREDDSARIHEDESYSQSGNEAGYIRNSVKGFILRFDQMYLREWFGGEISMRRSPSKTPLDRSFGDYELGNLDDMTDD